MISFRFKTTHFDNQYDLYSRKFADGTSMIKGFDITVSYETVSGIVSLFIINEIQSTEGLIIFILDIFNDFQILFGSVLKKWIFLVYCIYTYNYSKENGQVIHLH